MLLLPELSMRGVLILSGFVRQMPVGVDIFKLSNNRLLKDSPSSIEFLMLNVCVLTNISIDVAN